MGAHFSIVHRVLFPETDMAGVAHFSNFFKWMEEVEHAFFRSVGLSVAMQHEGLHIGWPRVSTQCEFFAPVRFEDEVTLLMRVTKVGEKSFNYEVDFTSNGKKIATGKMTSVCCTMTPTGMKAIPIPPEMRGKLEGISNEGRMANE